jgi:hypothetical protein
MSEKDKVDEYSAPVKKADTGHRELTHTQKKSEDIKKSDDTKNE